MSDNSNDTNAVNESNPVQQPTAFANVVQDESVVDVRFLFVEILKKWWLIVIFLKTPFLELHVKH